MANGIEEVKREVTKQEVRNLLMRLGSSVKLFNYLTAGKYACRVAAIKDVDIISIPCKRGRRYFISN